MGIIEGKITYFLPSTIIKNSLLNLSGLLIVGIGVLLPPVPWIIMVPVFKILSIIVCETYLFSYHRKLHHILNLLLLDYVLL